MGKKFNAKCMFSLILSMFMVITLFAQRCDSEAAGKVSVYVVTKIAFTTKDRVKTRTTSRTITTKQSRTYDYSKNGLAVKFSLKSTNNGGNPNLSQVNTYNYSGKKVTSVVTSEEHKQTKKIVRNKKGNVIKEMVRYEGDSKYVDLGYKFKYDSKNRMISRNDNGFSIKYKYDKKDRIKETSVQKMTYDDKGYVNSIRSPKGDNEIPIKNTYKNGRLVKRKCGEVTYKISYKKITIPKSYEKLVNNQQRNIIELNTTGMGFDLEFIR